MIEDQLARARGVAEAVLDPELPVLTLADLGVLRSVEHVEGRIVVTLTPTYTACPALAMMRADLLTALARNGITDAEVRVVLSPAWSTDWITDQGRARLQEYGVAPPAHRVDDGPVDVLLGRRPEVPACPHCGSTATRELSRFGPTACTALHVCLTCAEPFEKMKEL